jgi:hypothetical protein
MKISEVIPLGTSVILGSQRSNARLMGVVDAAAWLE